jgi:hypothetical protein
MYTKTQLVEAFCEFMERPEQIEVDGQMVANPESKLQFIQRKQLEWAKNQAVRHLTGKAIAEAKLQVNTDSEGIDL